MKITVLNPPGALQSAVHGVGELVAMAHLAAASTGRSGVELRSEVCAVAAGSMPGSGNLGDVVFLPPLMAAPGTVSALLASHRNLTAWLRERDDPAVQLCACCTGVLLLGESGLLRGRRATTTWWLAPEFRERFPEIELQQNSMLVRDERFLTSAGPFSWVAAILRLIEESAGAELAQLCAKIAVVEPGRPAHGIFVVPNLTPLQDPLMLRAQEIVTRDLSRGITVRSLAKAMGMTERTLLRRTRELAGMTPRELIARTRIEVAKTLLETSHEPIVEISSAAGFEDDSSFRAAFSRAVGITPSAYRSRMNPHAMARH